MPAKPKPSIPVAVTDRPIFSRTVLLFCAAIALVTLAAYWRSGSCGFVNLDDDAYVEFQPMVNQGLRSAAVVWAFTSVHSTNWHPLTTLSHILDCTLFGLNPAPMHWENILLHVLNSLLVFLVWRALARRTWPAALVALLFALHPLHVESVAWISERKDVLSAFFWLLGLAAYVRRVRSRPPRGQPWLVIVCFTLALLSKPMAVTFPFTLLLLDYWPLARFPTQKWTALVREKIPFFLLAFAHAAVTFAVQHGSGAADYGARLTLAARLGNALVSYVRYLGKTILPLRLSPFYAHPGYWPAWMVASCAAFLLAVTWLAWRQRNARPWLLFGWLWYLVTLLPVIGLVQVGAQSMADRYTYIPLLGIFTILAWAGAGLCSRFPKMLRPLSVAVCASLAACAFLTQRQVGAWQNSARLYEQTIAGGEDNATLHYLLALALQSAGRPVPEVKAQFEKAIAIQPDYVNAWLRLCIMAIGRHDYGEARALLEKAARLEPRNPAIRVDFVALDRINGDLPGAMAHINETLGIDPRNVQAHRELASIYNLQGRFIEVQNELTLVTRLAPWDPVSWNDLGAVYSRTGRVEEARQCFQRALWIDPKFTTAETNLRLLGPGAASTVP